MNWNTTPYTFREYCMLGIILFLMIGFAAILYAQKATIKSYVKGYNECIKKLSYEVNGYAADINMTLPNITGVRGNYQ